MVLLITAMSIALIVSALCSLMEATLLSLTPTQVARMAETHPLAVSTWQKLKSDIQKPIAVILVFNTLSHTIGATVAGAQFESLYGKEWLALDFVEHAEGDCELVVRTEITEVVHAGLKARAVQRVLEGNTDKRDARMWRHLPTERVQLGTR